MSAEPPASSAATLQGADPSKVRTLPLLSLCLATYNRAHCLEGYLSHHLEAFEAAGIDYELVVSDNCSTDETPEILAAYASRYPRMRVTRQLRNIGAYPNILTTLHQAHGEIVVSIADDDRAITSQLIAYVELMRDQPQIAMLQAPWFLVDETRDGATIGKFYDFEGVRLFPRGDYANCLAFVLGHHVFPECWLMRRAMLPAIAEPARRFTYSFFSMLAHALGKGQVMFCPEPHIRATAVSKDASQSVGEGEAMEAWDVYRGGLELLASYARQFNPGVLVDPAAVGRAISNFVCVRMTVAARLQARARNWSNAYQILRRLHAYELTPSIGVAANVVARLAALETTLVESSQRGATEIVVDHSVPDHALARLNPIPGVRVIRADAVRPDDLRRAYCGPPPAGPMREQDFCCEISVAMERFPLFPEP